MHLKRRVRQAFQAGLGTVEEGVREAWPMRSERGAITILAALVIALLVAVALVLIELADRAATRAEAQAVADVIALAHADDGPGTALEVALANDVVDAVTTVSEGGNHRIDVAVRGQHATAQAREGRTVHAGLIPALSAAIERAGDLLGGPIVVVSGWRSPDEQQTLWDNRHANPFPVAAPGTSLHEQGRAVDVPAHQVDLLASVAHRVGLCQPLPESDPIHFIWCGDG